MHLPGHVSIALLQHMLPPLSRRRGTLTPLLAASLFPDVVDKTLGYVLHVMPNGRHVAHNLFSFMGLSLLVTLVWGREAGLGWFMGYLGHLLADFNTALPWFFPLRTYHFEQKRFTFGWQRFFGESVGLAVVLLLYWLGRPAENRD